MDDFGPLMAFLRQVNRMLTYARDFVAYHPYMLLVVMIWMVYGLVLLVSKPVSGKPYVNIVQMAVASIAVTVISNVHILLGHLPPQTIVEYGRFLLALTADMFWGSFISRSTVEELSQNIIEKTVLLLINFVVILFLTQHWGQQVLVKLNLAELEVQFIDELKNELLTQQIEFFINIGFLIGLVALVAVYSKASFPTKLTLIMLTIGLVAMSYILLRIFAGELVNPQQSLVLSILSGYCVQLVFNFALSNVSSQIWFFVGLIALLTTMVLSPGFQTSAIFPLVAVKIFAAGIGYALHFSDK